VTRDVVCQYVNLWVAGLLLLALMLLVYDMSEDD
jgi:hypothetical protein